jgi:hypothetical protein
LGYTAEDSATLAKTWQTQAAEKFAKGEYTLGKLDQYGQRIDQYGMVGTVSKSRMDSPSSHVVLYSCTRINKTDPAEVS